MNELMTLIDLCPGTRLPQYEPEIFSDLVLAEYYLHKLCEWYDHNDSVPRMVYRYARYGMKCRWPEAEPVMAADREYRMWYNRHFGTSL